MSSVSTARRASKPFSSLMSNLFNPLKLGWITNKLPMKLNCLIIQQLINNIFSEQISDGDFDFLENRLLQLEVLDASIFIGLSYHINMIKCIHFGEKATESDVTLSIDTKNAIKLIQQEIDPDTLFFHRKLKIQGDTELAHQVKNTIDTLDPEVIPALLMKFISDYKKWVLSDL